MHSLLLCVTAGSRFTWHLAADCRTHRLVKTKPTAAKVTASSRTSSADIDMSALSLAYQSMVNSNAVANLAVSFTPDSGCSKHMVSN